MDYALAASAVIVLLALYVSWLASRVERMQARCAAARLALAAQLGRRAASAARLAARQADDDGLRAAADAAVLASEQDDPIADERRPELENDLTSALRRAVAAGTAADPVVGELVAESRRLTVARQVYNDAVRDTLSLRGARVPRLFRLGRRQPMPSYFDIDELDLDRALAGHGTRPHAGVTDATDQATAAELDRDRAAERR